MTLRTTHAMVGALTLSAALILPTLATDAASASTGGTAAGDTPAAAAPDPAPAGHGITLSVGGGALVNRALRVTGVVPHRYVKRKVLIQLSGGGTRWSTVASASPDRGGNFSVRWTSHRSGRFALRATIDRVARGARTAPSSALARITVYPSAIATWYGPGSNRVLTTACGTQLTSTTIGVAHRSLPCGTPVELYYRGRTVVAPVIDRGPYANGADWDMTSAAADALGFTDAGVDRIGALRLA